MKLIFLLFLFLKSFLLLAQSNIKVHSHNDYEQNEPFYAAFMAKSSSIEVDIFLKDQKLYVGHNLKDLTNSKTLAALYLEPILKVIKSKEVKNLQILIDIKTEAISTLNAIENELLNFPELISKKSKIKFVISGNRPSHTEYANYPNFINFDHQSLDNLNLLNLDKVALFSFPFYKYSKWNGIATPSKVDDAALKKNY